MLDIAVIENAAAAEVALDPIRARLLADLAQPRSATMLGVRFGLPRQKINYHLKALERHGLVELVEERRKGNVNERLLRATAASYVISPLALAAVQRAFTLRGDGRNLIDFMYVDDAIDGFLRLLTHSSFTGTVDFASGCPVTVNQVARTMTEVLGVDLTIRHEGHTEEYIRFHSVDRTMRERCGFEPKVPFSVGIGRLRDFLVRETHGTSQPA